MLPSQVVAPQLSQLHMRDSGICKILLFLLAEQHIKSDFTFCSKPFLQTVQSHCPQMSCCGADEAGRHTHEWWQIVPRVVSLPTRELQMSFAQTMSFSPQCVLSAKHCTVNVTDDWILRSASGRHWPSMSRRVVLTSPRNFASHNLLDHKQATSGLDGGHHKNEENLSFSQMSHSN